METNAKKTAAMEITGLEATLLFLMLVGLRETFVADSEYMNTGPLLGPLASLILENGPLAHAELMLKIAKAHDATGHCRVKMATYMEQELAVSRIAVEDDRDVVEETVNDLRTMMENANARLDVEHRKNRGQ